VSGGGRWNSRRSTAVVRASGSRDRSLAGDRGGEGEDDDEQRSDAEPPGHSGPVYVRIVRIVRIVQ
jgi:hypothetical protein